MDFLTLIMETNLKGFTQYCNFPFTSFCRLSGKDIAVGPTGVYELGGDTDEGEDISGSFSLINSDFGIENQKRIRSIFFGYDSEDDLTVSTEDDEGNVRNYTLSLKERNVSHGGKVQIGRDGLGRYWKVSIANTEGCNFGVDSISILPVILNRTSRKYHGD